MVQSKGWEWEKADQSPWLKPTEDVYFLAHKWRELGYKKILDLGSGLGRHAIYFAKEGFEVTALDISEYAVNHLSSWAKKENLEIEITLGDIIALPYEADSFDCVLAYHSISHADTVGMKVIISEIERVLRKGGELYTSMCSKDSWNFRKGGFPKIDKNTILFQEDGPENNVPHFFADREDLLELFGNFDIEKIRHIDYCYLNGKKQDCKHYYISGRKK